MNYQEYSIWRWFIGLFSVAYILFSLATISSYQVPWFDEVYYADAAWSFLNYQNFSVPIDFPRTSGETLHSPLFSVIQAGIIKLFGFGPWQIRLLPLLSGLAIFLIMSVLVYRYTKSDKYTLFFMLLFMSDRVINLSLHSGRMDMLSLFFVVLSILIFEKTLKWQGNILPVTGAIFAGLILSAGFLTALRIAVAALPCVLLLVLFNPERRASYYSNLIVYGAVAVLPLILWQFYGYGGVMGAVATETSKAGFASHFGILSSFVGNVFRRPNEIPKMLLFYGSFVFLVFFDFKKIRKTFWFCMYALITLGFILFVIEGGPYRAMFFPFVYAVVVMSVSVQKLSALKRLGKILLVSLLGLNILYSMPRMIGLGINWHAIQPDLVQEEIRFHVPAGSRVITDYRFYYILRNHGCTVLIPIEEDVKKEDSRIRDYPAGEFQPEYVLGGEYPISGLAGKTEFVTMVGIPPVTMSPKLQRFVWLERLMPRNHYHAPLFRVQQQSAN